MRNFLRRISRQTHGAGLHRQNRIDSRIDPGDLAGDAEETTVNAAIMALVEAGYVEEGTHRLPSLPKDAPSIERLISVSSTNAKKQRASASPLCRLTANRRLAASGCYWTTLATTDEQLGLGANIVTRAQRKP